MKKLRPQPLKESDYADIKAQLEALFYQVLFKPVMAIIAPQSRLAKEAAREMRNAPDDAVSAAIRSGAVQYSNGVFSGVFNASISKALRAIGASFNKQTKVFTLAPDRVPPQVKAVAHKYNETARKVHEETLKALDEIERTLDGEIDSNPVNGSVMIGKVEKGMDRSAAGYVELPELDAASKARLRKQYAESLKPFIKEFSQDTVRELREAVEANAAEGYRFDRLVPRIQSRYDVSRSKAEFLARNETARYVSLHRRAKFEQVGVTQYVWRTAGDSRVREDHKKLNGRTFDYANPPVVDDSTGRRANPGADYNCRCSDEPILPGTLTNAASSPTAALQETNR